MNRLWNLYHLGIQIQKIDNFDNWKESTLNSIENVLKNLI